MPETGSNFTPDTAHQAEGPQAPEATIPHIRALAQPFRKSQLIQNEDGSLLIKGVPMLASGTWTDSAVQTPLFYPEKTLENMLRIGRMFRDGLDISEGYPVI